ncbi:hypothetical protein E3T26_09850 [Cryobacterium sp. TMT1-21]|uniref:DUF1269 domain-containing protein n=1 Tax=Cryobacterium shii TaxID=1259235 RepID=A0AAQ2C4J0_9MICO|nr:MULTISPECIES: DUF6325 family protein [Cryobacterium]TFC42550.1 hypothetical protein E3O49_14500 [Cryobacterium shii]TFC80882.1 hypothetical protein E3T24_16045 [Cryobacterium sp. TmT2-59]TFD13191.1 hypothetical protein E3T26_09850 [Cryobacterium sp. TMT1-21]TFD18612.1 hypothetical protein E3T42_05140 [Cryobacterium sp. TMT4-10]TFD36664.1 hypothetical protein E3T37_13665 [Cryobacterium sp. TMT2-10]
MLGPIEILVIAFPGNRFTGEILPALADLVDTDTISIIDGVFVRKDEDGTISYSEFEELGVNEDAMALTDVIEMINGLVSDEDVEELAADLENDSSAAILVFEHTWFKPLRDAIVSSGGVLVDTVRIPGAVVDEVLEALAEADADTD